MHALNPLVPRGETTIYTFGQEAPFDELVLPHSGPLGIRTSTDDGHTWSEPTRIEPENDPDYKGVCHMQMAETNRDSWLIGTYTIERLPTEDFQRRDIPISAEEYGPWANLYAHPRSPSQRLDARRDQEDAGRARYLS